MQVDYGPLDERKEGGDGALLDAEESDHGGSTDFPMQVDHGQSLLS